MTDWDEACSFIRERYVISTDTDGLLIFSLTNSPGRDDVVMLFREQVGPLTWAVIRVPITRVGEADLNDVVARVAETTTFLSVDLAVHLVCLRHIVPLDIVGAADLHSWIEAVASVARPLRAELAAKAQGTSQRWDLAGGDAIDAAIDAIDLMRLYRRDGTDTPTPETALAVAAEAERLAKRRGWQALVLALTGRANGLVDLLADTSNMDRTAVFDWVSTQAQQYAESESDAERRA